MFHFFVYTVQCTIFTFCMYFTVYHVLYFWEFFGVAIKSALSIILDLILIHLNFINIGQVEKLQQQLKWKGFPGIHALLLKGCTSPTTYEHAVKLLIKLTQMTDLLVRIISLSLFFVLNFINFIIWVGQNCAVDTLS